MKKQRKKEKLHMEEQLLSAVSAAELTFNEDLLRFFLRYAAEQLCRERMLTTITPLLRDLLPDASYSDCYKLLHPLICGLSFSYTPEEDTLGFLYQSLQSLQERKRSGTFYTPTSIVKKLIADNAGRLSEATHILDPSCGTGSFLLCLPDTLSLSVIYGSDVNPLAVTLTRINLALKYAVSSKQELELLYSHITVRDYLEARASSETDLPDCILGNPPWGAALSAGQKQLYKQYFLCAKKASIEIFDLFLEQALKELAPGGTLAFVLPEALLTVKSHTAIRKLLLEQTTLLSVEYLGDVFAHVYCPSILLSVRKKEPVTEGSDDFCLGARITKGSETYTIQTKRALDEAAFSLLLTDAEAALLKKLTEAPHLRLKGNADFALGIVTGNNAAFLSESVKPGYEPFIKGSDLSQYHIQSHSGFLCFDPEQLQQTAPEHLYRAEEKLFYRFIHRTLVFAYDNTGLLSLNSCNILIPRFEGLSVKYVLAVLNSAILQFVFEKTYHSVKVLRSHLESLPIPAADTRTQQRIEALVDCLMDSTPDSTTYITAYQTLEQELCTLFEVTQDEYALITETVAK